MNQTSKLPKANLQMGYSHGNVQELALQVKCKYEHKLELLVKHCWL